MKKYSYKIVCRNCGNVEGMGRRNLDLTHLICSKCKKTGTTLYIKERNKAVVKKKWKLDDRVIVDFDDEPFVGSISELTKTKATVLFDDGEVHDIRLKELKSETQNSTSSTIKNRGFYQYDIKWDKDSINFRFKAEDGEFYGWWRRIQVKNSQKIGYAIDLMVKYQEHKFNVETLSYIDEDPRDDLDSLNADICAAANKWFYHKCQGTFDTIEDLQQRATKPVITISHLETLDRIIISLKEYRDTAIRSGGFRIMTFTGDNPETEPSMRIQMDLTRQAAALKGRVPSLSDGVILDRTSEDSSKKTKGRGKSLKAIGDPKNIEDLLRKLQTSKDKTEQQKIRAALRRMGHKGGTRKPK